VRADLIDDFLDQGGALVQNGYRCAAVSLAGAVLEDTLRKLCDKHAVSYDPRKTSIEALNMELARASVYDKLVQKEITAKAHLRNDVDHGRLDNAAVKTADVEDMLRWVRRFVQEHLRQECLYVRNAKRAWISPTEVPRAWRTVRTFERV
jgi:hypothetical protein